jgi:hypothetical protein
LQSFDAANGLASVAQRNVTTTPVQALLMFNGEYTIGRSKKLAERIQGLKVGAPAEALTFAFKLVWGRNPSESELGRAITYVATAPQQESSEMDNERLVDLCHVLLNSNEFLYVD